MQSAFATHSLIWAATPEHLLLGTIFLLAALILFSLALEAGTYPDVAKGFRQLGKILRRNCSPVGHFPSRGQVP